MYFVIHNSDGATYITALTEDKLKKRLAEEYWGPVGFLSKVPDSDTNYWGENILITVPQAVQTVTEYKL